MGLTFVFFFFKFLRLELRRSDSRDDLTGTRCHQTLQGTWNKNYLEFFVSETRFGVELTEKR